MAMLNAGGSDLHMFRLLQRRFIVYQPSKATATSEPQGPELLASPDADSHPSAQSVLPCGSTSPVRSACPAGLVLGLHTPYVVPSVRSHFDCAFCLTCFMVT